MSEGDGQLNCEAYWYRQSSIFTEAAQVLISARVRVRVRVQAMESTAINQCARAHCLSTLAASPPTTAPCVPCDQRHLGVCVCAHPPSHLCCLTASLVARVNTHSIPFRPILPHLDP